MRSDVGRSGRSAARSPNDLFLPCNSSRHGSSQDHLRVAVVMVRWALVRRFREKVPQQGPLRLGRIRRPGRGDSGPSFRRQAKSQLLGDGRGRRHHKTLWRFGLSSYHPHDRQIWPHRRDARRPASEQRILRDGAAGSALREIVRRISNHKEITNCHISRARSSEPSRFQSVLAASRSRPS
jgi:hypothetical protein